MAALTEILDACLSPDNAIRTRGEEALKAAATNPTALILGLLQIVATDANEGRRSSAAVFLRKQVADSKGGFASLDATSQDQLKAALLTALANEQVVAVKRKVCHVIAEVASKCAGAGFSGWQPLLPAVFTVAQSSDADARGIALFLYRQLVTYCGEESVAPHSGQLKVVLGKLLQDPVPVVAAAALQGATVTITALKNEAARKPYLELMPSILRALEVALNPETGDEEAAKDALRSLIEVVQGAPVFMRDFIQPAAHAMLSIINYEGFDDDTRTLGLEFLLQLAENAGATVRKYPELIQHILTLSTRVICEVAEDKDWAAKDSTDKGFYVCDGGDEEDDTSELVKAGVAAIDRLASAIGGKLMKPALESTLAPMLTSPDWKLRRAALTSMALALHGCKKVFAPMARTLVQQFSPFLKDPHPRVRHAAVRFFTQMAEDYNDPNEEVDGAGNAELAANIVSQGKGGAARAAKAEATVITGLSESAGDVLLPVLIEAVGAMNKDIPRLRGVAAEAISTFLDETTTDVDVVLPFKDALLAVLFSLVRELPASFEVSLGSALSAIASTASVLGEHFSPHYNQLMPSLKQLISTATGPSKKFLRNRALDCLSRVCEAVGREVAGMDAAECLQGILMQQKANVDSEESEDAESAEALVSAMARLAECLAADFVPYLPFILAIYLPKATRKIEVRITQGQEGNDDPNAISVAVDEGVLMNKVVGARMLVALVQTLGIEVPGMWQYLDQIAQALAIEINGNLPQVRELAVVGLSGILQGAMADTNNLSHAQAVFDVVMPALAARLGEGGERVAEIMYIAAEGLEEALKNAFESTKPDYKGINAESKEKSAGGAAALPNPAAIPRACLKPEQVPALFAHLHYAFTQCVERRKEQAQEILANPDADEEDAEKLAVALEDEDEMMGHCVDALGYAIKMAGQAALPSLGSGPNTLGGTVLSWLDSREDWDTTLRAAAVCLADDLIEFASPASHQIIPVFIPHLFDCCKSKHSRLRQPATYGLGILAQHGGDSFLPHVGAAVAALSAVVQAPDSRNEDGVFATDNAVSALIKICKYRAGHVDTEAIMTACLAYLPFRADGIEACLVHGWMVEALATLEPLWIGPNGSRAGIFLSALARALAAHRANVEKKKTTDEDDEEGDDDEEELLDAKHLAALRGLAGAIKAGPAGAQFAALLSSLPKKQQEALAYYGFRL